MEFQMASPQDIVRLTAMLSAAYPNWNVTEYTNEIYFQDLRDIQTDELMTAAQHCRSEAGRKFAPSVGELRGAVMELRSMSLNVKSAYAAWEEVCKQINDNGGDFGKPVWSSSLIERAVNYLGWRNLRMSEDATSDRMRFIQAYEQLLARASKEEMLIPEVRGFIEDRGAKLLASPSEQIKQLAQGMKK
jgi:hypothetical protein